jgi:mycothiol synthase
VLWLRLEVSLVHTSANTSYSVSPFQWKDLSELSGLINRLGQHGFRLWPKSPDLLQSELEVLRLEPEQDAFILRRSGEICGYAITQHERDIHRTVISIAAFPECHDHAGPLLDAAVERARRAGVGAVHVAIRGTTSEPVEMVKGRGFVQVATNIELQLSRAAAEKLVEKEVPRGFAFRKMRSSAETLLLTRTQNAVFEGHWGFSSNTPEEIQARLDLVSSGPEHVLFVENAEGDIAAYIWTAIEWHDEHTGGRIWMTGVMPQFRGLGIGAAVVHAGIKHLLAEGATEVRLEVVAHNTAAVRIYENVGFKTTGGVDWYELKLR